MSEKSSLTDFEQGIIQGRIQGRKQMEEQLIDSCSYCDRKIPFGEIYFAMALNKERLIKDKEEIEIEIVQSDTIILWCKDCFPKFNPIPENKEVENK